MSRSPQGLFAALLLGAVPSAQAQDDPGLGAEQGIEVADERPPAWRPFHELLLRGDRVTGLPGGREDLERERARVRAGGEWSPDRWGRWTLGVALEGAIGTGSNKRSLANNDVEDVDGAGVDELWVRRRFAGESPARAELVLGKARLPLDLSPMLWDEDLRPVGASLRLAGTARDFHLWEVTLGGFEPDPLGETGPRLTAIQAGWELPSGLGARLAYLDWSGLDRYARVGLGRGNSIAAGRYRSDYDLLDLQVYWRTQLGGKQFETRIDRVRNLDAAAANDGTRASVVYGDRFDADQLGWELGWAWQRIQRDAVVAAVTADDWWFHTAARGHMPWLGYGFRSHWFGAAWSMRLAGFYETRDGRDERTKRILLDLEARW